MTSDSLDGIMDFGTKSAFDGQMNAADAMLPLAWFERSTAERPLSAERGGVDSAGLLDRLRETGGLVYSGDNDDEL